MKRRSLSRRDFIKRSAGTAVILSVIPSKVSTCYGAFFSGPITRKDVRDLSPDEIDKYQEAFRRVKTAGPERPVWHNGTIDLPDQSALSKVGYAYQALIHSHNCPHRNWWFLPWHRAYLYTFEQILIAAVAGYKPGVALAIPYWNWTEQMGIPALFSDSSGSNPLFEERRYSEPITAEDVGPDVIRRDVDQASAFVDFGSGPSCAKQTASFEAAFESGPHDTVHGNVGGGNDPSDPMNPATWGTMTTTWTSTFDPIFWSHHANIDRLWNVWLSQSGHSNPSYSQRCPNPGSTVTWGNMRFNEFVNADGTMIDRTVQDFLEDPAIQSIVYQPHTGPVITLMAKNASAREGDNTLELPIERAKNQKGPFALETGKPLTLVVPLPENVRPRLTAFRDSSKESLRFRIDGLQPPANFTRLRVRVFLNNPNANADTPVDDPSYVNYIAFFDTSHPGAHNAPEHGKGGDYAVNLAPAIRKLGAKFSADQPMTITLVMVPKLTRMASSTSDRSKTPATFHNARLLLGQ